jgi:hypothetical protein
MESRALHALGDRLVSIESGRIVVRARSDGTVVSTIGRIEGRRGGGSDRVDDGGAANSEGGGEFGRPVLLADGSVVVGSGPRAVREFAPDGRPRWRFRVGAAVEGRALPAPVRGPGMKPPREVMFASREGVLYSVSRGGSMNRRAILPSRPFGDPLLLSGAEAANGASDPGRAGAVILVPCFEDEVMAFDPLSPKPLGRIRFPGGFASPPVLAGSHLVATLSSPPRLAGVKVRPIS